MIPYNNVRSETKAIIQCEKATALGLKMITEYYQRGFDSSSDICKMLITLKTTQLL
jgi:hypothetical protein